MCVLGNMIGRITVEHLAENLCIEQTSVENALKTLTTTTTSHWTIIDDLVLTLDYINQISKEVEDEINRSEYISIVTQAQHMKLPYSLLKSIIISLAEKDEYIYYMEIPDVISTTNYINNCKSTIMDELKSLDEYSPIFKLQKSTHIPEDLFYLLLEQIVKEKDFDLGILRGKRSRATFEPKSYKERQLILIKSIFDSNECISFNTIENQYPFCNPIDLIENNYDKNSYIKLNSCIIKTTVKDKAKATVECIKDYCDVNDLLPAGLTFEDVNKVIDSIMSEINNKNFVSLDGGYIATMDYIHTLVAESHHYLRNLSRTWKQKMNKNQSLHIHLSDKDIIKAFESIGCPHVIAEKVLRLTRHSMMNQFTDFLQTPYLETDAIVSGDKWIIEHKTRELKKLCNLRQTIYFNYKAMQLFEDPVTQKSLEKYILKNQCVEYAFHFVIYLVLDQSYNKSEVSQSTSLCISLEDIENERIIDSKQQKYVVSYFIRENDHKYDNTSVIEIEDLLKKKQLDKFVTNILINDKQGLFKGQALNYDQANKIIQQQLHSQLEQLPVSTSTVPHLLHIVSLLIFQKLFKIPLYVSGKFVPVILNKIRSLLPKDIQDLLDNAHLSIINNDREEHIEDYEKLKRIGLSYDNASL
ncbi:uncharacterized protein BX663DRAFT_510177 [Cokeromyces recurvatus]|uniref:uncharacterized protein n=1 Tax=Cokeromyces recurvatus TaxID=90255 RepID=UPI00221FD47B|nr:uncharacterized protein BX663DRAFT_510177 [Cokeromyces recurvatus]KAI7902698.1 hypothetical protein BX663DRAFT_510177 [Cokeromyces recurvatus]